MIKNKTFVLTILIFITSFIFYSWNIVPSYTFDNDSARDLVEIHEILEGDIRLVGPNASFGGLKTGPYYYYLFAPVLFLTNGSVEGFLYFNAFLFAFAGTFFYRSLSKKFSNAYAILGVFGIIVSPLFILVARNPGNANTYVAILLIIFTLLYFYKLTGKNLVVIGLLTGVIVNFQYANIVIFVPLTVYLFYKLQNKKLILYYLFPFLLSFAPLLLFEIRHDFIMTKTTLFTDSYKGFIANNQLGMNEVKRNSGETILFISDHIKNLIGISPIMVFLGIGLYLWKFHKKKRELSLFLFSGGVYMLTLLTLQFQFAIHYVFPAAFSILFLLVIFLLKEKQGWVLGIIIFFQLLLFPPLFNNSVRPYWFYKNVVEKTISSKIVKHPDSFSIIQIRPETSITPHGYEYRYFFILNNLYPLDIQNYNQSKQLLIFSRENEFNLAQFNTWEIQEFGKEYIKNVTKININGVDVYSIIK